MSQVPAGSVGFRKLSTGQRDAGYQESAPHSRGLPNWHATPLQSARTLFARLSARDDKIASRVLRSVATSATHVNRFFSLVKRIVIQVRWCSTTRLTVVIRRLRSPSGLASQDTGRVTGKPYVENLTPAGVSTSEWPTILKLFAMS